MEVLVGTLAVAVVSGVMTFATFMVKNAREDVRTRDEDVKWYRDQLLPALEKLTEAVEVSISNGSKRNKRGDVD